MLAVKGFLDTHFPGGPVPESLAITVAVIGVAVLGYAAYLFFVKLK